MSRFNEEYNNEWKFLPKCNKCKNYIDGLRCKAFDRIPDDILSSRFIHDKKYPTQDNDVLFEDKTKQDDTNRSTK